MKNKRNCSLSSVDGIFCEYILSSEEMICVRGGEGENPGLPPSEIPVKI